ncbi:MAG: 50S ribosomal protein L32e [Promethearchaeota archaeon]
MSIKIRKKLKEKIKKKRRKKFIRQESWRYKRVKPSWRKPKGIDSRMRIHHRGSKCGYTKSPSVGYRTPRVIRGLHPSGYQSVLVYCLKDLEKLKPKRHAIMISSKIGYRKRIKILEAITSRGFKLLNKGIEREEEIVELGGEIDLSLEEEEKLDLEDLELDEEDLEDIDLLEGEDEDLADEESGDNEDVDLEDLDDSGATNDVEAGIEDDTETDTDSDSDGAEDGN